MKSNYLSQQESVESEILGRLSAGTATEEDIQAVVNDINIHLSTPTGTLANYHGKYRAGLQSLQDNYNLFKNEDYYTHIKLATIFNAIAIRLIDGKKTVIPPAIFNKLLDYIQGNTTEVSSGIKYVTIGYEYAQNGNFFLPESKLPEKNM